MNQEPENEFITFEAACRLFGLTSGQLSRLLREHGLGEFVRASMRRDVLIRRRDLEVLIQPTEQGPKRRRSA